MYEEKEVTIHYSGKHARKARVRANYLAVATALFVVTTVRAQVVAKTTEVKASANEVPQVMDNQSTTVVEVETVTLPYGSNEDQYNDLVAQEIVRQMEEAEKQKAIVETQNTESRTVDEISEENSMPYTEADYKLLSRIIFAEAGNQSIEGQIAVGATILNRVASEIYPNTIRDVITQKGQFSSVKGGEVYAFGEVVNFESIPDSCKEAARRALQGEDPTEQKLRQEAIAKGLDAEKYASGGALFFYNPTWTSESELEMRNSIAVKVVMEDHIFYKVW